MPRTLRYAAAIVLSLFAVVPWTGVKGQNAPPALSPLAQLLQPYLLPASAVPAGFQQDAVQEVSNVATAAALRDPDAIQALVQRQRIIGVAQVFHQSNGPLRFVATLDLYRDSAGSQAALRDVIPPSGVSGTLTRLPAPPVGDTSIGVMTTVVDSTGASIDSAIYGFTVGRLVVSVVESGPSGMPQLADLTGPVQVLVAQATAQPLPPPGDLELQQLATQTTPTSILYDAYRFLLAFYLQKLEPAKVLAAGYSGAVKLVPPGAAAPAAPVITSADPDGAWAQFLPAYRQLEGLVGAAQARELAYAAARVMYRPFPSEACGAAFLTPPLWQRQLSGAAGGSQLGIGLYLTVQRNDPVTAGLRIDDVAPGSPAEAAGLHPGDRIVAIDGMSDVEAGDLTSFELLVTDTSANSAARHLTVYRPNVSGPLEFTVVPQLLTLPLERHQILPGGIGYIDLRRFPAGDAAVDAVRAVLGEFAADGNVKGIVLDLRHYGGGGFASTMVRIASLFLPADIPAVTVVDQQGREQVARTSGTPVAGDVPLVGLVGRGTTSSAELFAETLQDLGRAQILGERSSGCVNLEQFYGLLDTAGVGIAAYTSYAGPQRVPLQGVGVTPDVAVDLSDEDLAAGNDPQLQAAVDLLQGGSPATADVAVPPVAPTGVQMDVLGATSIRVRWDNNAGTTADGYKLYDPVNGQPIEYAEADRGATEFTLVGLAPGQEYCVVVYAFNRAGKSPPSESRCATTRSS